MRIRFLAASWFALLAIAVAAWWILIALVPSTRAWFVAPGASFATLRPFVVPDTALLVFGSIACALAIVRGHAVARIHAWILVGAVWYATLSCLGVSIQSGGAWLATILMLAAAAPTQLAAWSLEREARRSRIGAPLFDGGMA